MATAPLVLSSQHLLRPNGSITGSEVAKSILPAFPSLLSALPVESSRRALASMDGRQAITHAQIRDFILEIGERLHSLQIGRGHRVAVVLPNGSELALAILAVSTWACCVPLNAFGAKEEFEKDLKAVACDLIIGLEEDAPIAALAESLHMPFAGVRPHPDFCGLFQLSLPTERKPQPSPLRSTFTFEADRSAGNTQSPRAGNHSFQPNMHDDEILVLFTSGTTGGKKLVPHLLADILVATACISVSWKLSPEDTNCNLMPLFHVGGIIRQVFSPVLSGGAVICCPSFDPNIFWQLMKSQGSFNWYYASPTMHAMILQVGKQEGWIGRSTRPRRLKMIANAAGGLSPSLARELRDTFGANVLPSYGMTECMPISSPPANYQLEKPGTSGVSVGPEIEIIDTTNMEKMRPNQEGPICVRGEPCFRGYGVLYGGADGNKPETFLPGGWFNTGDLGYIDEDGFLYITGRSKEVINRGGEIISPLEVEEAVNSHPNVEQSVAFSTKHSVLQEVVGIVIVTKPGCPRLDLPLLHHYLGAGRLAAAKWPQCLVYMDGVPKSHTNKLLRVKLGQRLCLPEVNDGMHAIERTFQARCPKVGTPVGVNIPCARVTVNPAHVEDVLRKSLTDGADKMIKVVPHPERVGALVAHAYKVPRVQVVEAAYQRLDAYLIPTHVCELSSPLSMDHEYTPPQSSDAVAAILMEAKSVGQGPTDPLVMSMQELFQDLLDLDCLPAPDTSFFNLGGSSMLASQLASKIRKLHNVPFGGAEVFHHNNCGDIAGVVQERQDAAQVDKAPDGSISDHPMSVMSSLYSKNMTVKFDPVRMDSFSGCSATFFQLLPIVVVYPIWQLSRFFIFFRVLLKVLGTVPGGHNLVSFVLTLVIFHAIWVTFTPLLFVAMKWLIIGKYREGRFELWGDMYLRWWFLDVMRKLIGRGAWGSHEGMLNVYYRMLGAKIGKGARISLQAEIAEYDLVEIGEGAAIEHSTVRGFGVDNGAMMLGPVRVGDHASVGARSVVAPFTSVPDHQHLGAVSSSYEVNAATDATGSDAKHLLSNRQALPEPNNFFQSFVARPIMFAVDTLSHVPALLVLFWMVKMPWHHDEPFNNMSDLMEWLCDVRRIPFYIGIRLARAMLAPFFYMAGAIVVKRLVIGKFVQGPRNIQSQWQLTRHHLAAHLFSRENMQDVTELIGRHYELVSVLYRILGARVGKRVFWPGHQPIFSGEFDLLEIGDDVVFGSRSAIFCTTATSCEKVILCAGANVSDNTVVLPGSVIGKNAVLGSNSVCPAGRYLPESSVWFGSRDGEPVMLERGVAGTGDGIIQAEAIKPNEIVLEGDDSTLRPFGRAFYHREAPYFVWPLSFIVMFTALAKIFIALIHTIPLLGALHLTAGFFYGFTYYGRDYDAFAVSFSTLYVTMLSFFCFTNLIRVCIWILVEYTAKWGIVGRRVKGRFNYDECSYGQRWELYQIITRIRSFGRMNFLDFFSGTPFLSSFFRSLGAEVGFDCCLYPAGADPMMPEPDLVRIGDRCVVDCSSIICHLNTRGNFELAEIVIENNTTLRTRSRIQQGVVMESGSMLLEKSLAMTGEVIECDSIWHGSPAARISGYDTSSMGTTPSSDHYAYQASIV